LKARVGAGTNLLVNQCLNASRVRVSLSVAVALVALARADVVLAHGGGATVLPADAPAVTAEGEKAKAQLAEIAADPDHRSKFARLLEKGERALARAHGAKLATDSEGARLLSNVALAWANAAGAAVRATTSVRAADVLSTKRVELAEKLSRAKSLLAEHDARRLGLQREVEISEREAASTPVKKPDPAKPEPTKKPAPGKKPDPAKTPAAPKAEPRKGSAKVGGPK
jgi:hypothetical protein